ncbi:hypothetical protein [Sphingomonas sp.]|uniref:hypothetical protein n=1 Tax=Sphingomonas sp. TaxID=28214 RepID=UPI002DD67A66|nr:hypothetical protein [Sphingomonas sp.]
MRRDADALAAGYGALFDPLVRAAHIACLEHARLTREDRWPTVQSCLDFAALYGIPGAELAAFFGFIGHQHSGRTIWVDAMRGPVPSYTARQGATHRQAVALGFQQMVAELPSAVGGA